MIQFLIFKRLETDPLKIQWKL